MDDVPAQEMEQGTLRALVSNRYATYLKTQLYTTTTSYVVSCHECRLLHNTQIVLQIMNNSGQTLLQR